MVSFVVCFDLSLSLSLSPSLSLSLSLSRSAFGLAFAGVLARQVWSRHMFGVLGSYLGVVFVLAFPGAVRSARFPSGASVLAFHGITARQ